MSGAALGGTDLRAVGVITGWGEGIAALPADAVSAAEWFAEDALPYRAIAFPSVRRTLRAYVRARRRARATGRSRRARAGSS